MQSSGWSKYGVIIPCCSSNPSVIFPINQLIILYRFGNINKDVDTMSLNKKRNENGHAKVQGAFTTNGFRRSLNTLQGKNNNRVNKKWRRRMKDGIRKRGSKKKREKGCRLDFWAWKRTKCRVWGEGMVEGARDPAAAEPAGGQVCSSRPSTGWVAGCVVSGAGGFARMLRRIWVNELSCMSEVYHERFTSRVTVARYWDTLRRFVSLTFSVVYRHYFTVSVEDNIILF